MLNLYRRHTPKCPHGDKGQNYTKCSCPIWCDGEVAGKRFRRSAGLRDWARAVKRVERWESEPQEAGVERTVKDAVDSFLSDCRARQLAPSSVRTYRKTLEHLVNYCEGHGVRFIADLDLETLTDFRATRDVRPATSRKELETHRVRLL